jgi:ADP-heptose:LPS heptosyltransferase
MKLSSRGLLMIDRFFWLPHRLLEILLIKSPERKTDHVLIIKFMGLGSLILFARLCEQHHVDKSKVTLLTFSHHKSFCELFGFRSTIFIRTSTVYHFIKDCLRAIRSVQILQPSVIIDYERCSHAVSTFRNWLAISCRCKTISFEVTRNIETSREIIYAIKEMTYQNIFLKGIEIIPKSDIDFPVKSIDIQSNRILININASDYLSARRYPLHSFVQLVKLLHQWNNQLEFHFTGVSSEKEYIDQLINQITECKAYNTAGQWSLETLMKELASCSLFITGDSGPMHIAACLNTPTIVLWGPTQPKHFGYENISSLHHLSLKMTCAPCFIHPQSNPAKACNGRIDCLKNLTPETVLKEAIVLLSQHQPTRVVSEQYIHHLSFESKHTLPVV